VYWNNTPSNTNREKVDGCDRELTVIFNSSYLNDALVSHGLHSKHLMWMIIEVFNSEVVGTTFGYPLQTTCNNLRVHSVIKVNWILADLKLGIGTQQSEILCPHLKMRHFSSLFLKNVLHFVGSNFNKPLLLASKEIARTLLIINYGLQNKHIIDIWLEWLHDCFCMLFY